MAADDDWDVDVTDLLPLSDTPRKLHSSTGSQAAPQHVTGETTSSYRPTSAAAKTSLAPKAPYAATFQAHGAKSKPAVTSQPQLLQQPTQMALNLDNPSTSQPETRAGASASSPAKPSLFQTAAEGSRHLPLQPAASRSSAAALVCQAAAVHMMAPKMRTSAGRAHLLWGPVCRS